MLDKVIEELKMKNIIYTHKCGSWVKVSGIHYLITIFADLEARISFEQFTSDIDDIDKYVQEVDDIKKIISAVELSQPTQEPEHS